MGNDEGNGNPNRIRTRSQTVRESEEPQLGTEAEQAHPFSFPPRANSSYDQNQNYPLRDLYTGESDEEEIQGAVGGAPLENPSRNQKKSQSRKQTKPKSPDKWVGNELVTREELYGLLHEFATQNDNCQSKLKSEIGALTQAVIKLNDTLPPARAPRVPRQENRPEPNPPNDSRRGRSNLEQNTDRGSDFFLPNPVDSPPRSSEEARTKYFDLNKWQLKFDGSSKEMTVESFFFRLEHIAETRGVPSSYLFKNFHVLLTGSANQFFWQLLEDHSDDDAFDYYAVKRAMLRHFQASQTDFEIIRELVERKQQYGETFDDFYAEMHNISFRLRNRMPEKDLVDIIKNNLRGSLASLIFHCTIYTLTKLKQECKRAEKMLKESRTKARQVSEVQGV